jgi:orotidine-5'-phosphate decarboxylase
MALDTACPSKPLDIHQRDRSSVPRIPTSQRLVVALDKPTAAEACKLVTELGSLVEVYKVGLELLFGDGLEVARNLTTQNKLVFLDMKLWDIPNTVEKAVANIARMKFNFLTVHGVDRKTIAAAVRGRELGDSRPKAKQLKLLAVTVLTSSTEEDLYEQGARERSKDLSVRRAEMAWKGGFDGVIASGHEAHAIRAATDEDFIIKVPGIRFGGAAVGDQARVMTPSEALREGADYLVVGRPIAEASNPVAAAKRFIEEIHSVLGQ